MCGTASAIRRKEPKEGGLLLKCLGQGAKGEQPPVPDY